MAALLLLPGLDGSARLFGRLIEHLPRDWEAIPVAYPSDRALDLDALVDLALARRPAGPYAIVAESFSGPIALKLAVRDPTGLIGLVLVATFVTPPVGRVVRRILGIAAGLAARLPVPRLASAVVLTGGDFGLAREIDGVMAPLLPEVLALRLRILATLDVRPEWTACRVPVLAMGGTRDRLVGRDKLKEMATLRPDVPTREFDSPHLVLQVRPQSAAREIVAFVSGLGGA